MTEYKMIDAETLSNFRRFMASGIPLTEFGPQGAFDTAMRKAKDDAPSAGRAVELVMKALEQKLGPDAFEALCDRICGEEADEPEAEDDDPATEFETPEAREMADAKDKKAKDKKTAKDSPPDFPGCPKTGAMDAAGDKRFDFVADMVRVKPDSGTGYTDRTSRARRAPSTASAERSFGEMYGAAAANIKVR
jgi:hypothetical protein